MNNKAEALREKLATQIKRFDTGKYSYSDEQYSDVAYVMITLCAEVAREAVDGFLIKSGNPNNYELGDVSKRRLANDLNEFIDKAFGVSSDG